MSSDPRYRTKLWLDTHLDNSKLLLDDGVTQAAYLVQFDNPNYDIDRVLLPASYGGKGIDLVYSVATPNSTGIPDSNGGIIGYNEQVPITVNAVSKAGLTGTKLRHQAELELRRLCETYWIGGYYNVNDINVGSFHSVLKISENTKPLGAFMLHSVTFLVTYERTAETAHASGYSISYKHGFIDDCVDLGDWTEQPAQANTTLTISEDGFFDLHTTNTSGTYYYSHTGVNTLQTNLNPKFRVRYKCENSSVNAYVKVVFTDGEQVFTLPNSQTLTTYTGTFTADKTMASIRIEIVPSAAGSIYYDFIDVYKGDFAFPNTRYGVEKDFVSKEEVLDAPGMGGDPSQGLGRKLVLFTLNCDITKGIWTRTLPNDQVSCEVLDDIQYNSTTEPWQWLITPTRKMKVRLVEYHEPEMASPEQMDWRLSVTFREYRDSDAYCSHENYRTSQGMAEA